MRKPQTDLCKIVSQKEYSITDEVLDNVLKKMANGKSGRDMIAGIWIKRLEGITDMYKEELQKLLGNEIEPQELILTSKTLLLPKNIAAKQMQNSTDQ